MRRRDLQPDCVCGEKWAQHAPRDPAERGYCLQPDCRCLEYRPAPYVVYPGYHASEEQQR